MISTIRKHAAPKESVSLLVSPYSSDQHRLHQMKTRAEDLFLSGNPLGAQQLFKDLRLLGVNYLSDLFADMDVDFQPLVGMYGADLEPSTMLDIYFREDVEQQSRNRLVRQRLIQFGRHFEQGNVHLIDFSVKKPEGIQYGELVEDTDITFQKKLWIQLNSLGKNSFDDYMQLKAIADNVGLGNLTLNSTASFILLYSMGKNGYLDFLEQSRNLLDVLSVKDRVFDSRINEDVALTNYGDAALGATHNYEEAEEFVKRMY